MEKPHQVIIGSDEYEQLKSNTKKLSAIIEKADKTMVVCFPINKIEQIEFFQVIHESEIISLLNNQIKDANNFLDGHKITIKNLTSEKLELEAKNAILLERYNKLINKKSFLSKLFNRRY